MTVDRYRAVGDALEKFCGRGRWTGITPRQTLPYFEFKWDHEVSDFWCGDAAVTRLYQDGGIVIVMKSTLPPARMHETMLHELQHLVDRRIIRSGRRSRDYLERRAEVTSAIYARIP